MEAALAKPTRSEATRRLRFFLRDFRMVEGSASLAVSLSLGAYLGNRKGYINLTDARWASGDTPLPHLVLKVSQIFWASCPGGEVPLVNTAAATEPKPVEIQLEGGLLIHGGLTHVERQRLGDYLEACGPFVGLHDAVLTRSRRAAQPVNVVLGDIVVNQTAIEAAWQLDEFPPRPESDAARASAGRT